MKKPIITFSLFVLLSSFLVSACGQKGPLYVPDNPDRTAKEELEDYYKRY